MNCYKFKHFRCLQTLTRLSNILILNVVALRNNKGSSQSSSFTGSQKHSSRLGVNLFQSKLTVEPCSQCSTPPPQNSPCLRVLKQFRQQGCLMNVKKSCLQVYSLLLRSFERDTHSFLLSSPISIHLSGQDFKEKDHARISFSQKRGIILEIESGHQSIPPGELNDPVTSFICSTSEQINFYQSEFWKHDYLFLLNQLSLFLQAKSSTYTGKFHSTPLVKIQVHPLRPPPRINKCPIRRPSRHKSHNSL